METPNKHHLLKISMHYGAIVGGILSIPVFLYYIAGNINSQNLPSIQHMLCFPCIAFYIRWYRDKFSGGELKYLKALKIGSVLMIFASVIIAFIIFLFYTLDGEIFAQYISLLNEAVIELPTSEEFKKLWVESLNLMTPTTMAIGKIFEFCIFGFIFSLIIAVFVRKRRVINNN